MDSPTARFTDLFERSMARRLARRRRLTEVIEEGRRTADAIGRAVVQWRSVPPRRLARTGSDR